MDWPKVHEGCRQRTGIGEHIYGETHINAHFDSFEKDSLKAFPHSWCPINAFVFMEELTLGTQYMSTNGDNMKGLELRWGGVRGEHLLVWNCFSFLLSPRFCSVPGFSLPLLQISLLWCDPGTLWSFGFSFKLSDPLGFLVNSPSLVVGKDTVSPAYCFLPDTEDRHTNHLCFLGFCC